MVSFVVFYSKGFNISYNSDTESSSFQRLKIQIKNRSIRLKFRNSCLLLVLKYVLEKECLSEGLTSWPSKKSTYYTSTET